MITLAKYIERFQHIFPGQISEVPWRITQSAIDIILEKIRHLNGDYKILNNVAIHKSVTIDSHAILKGPAIISRNCFIGAHCSLRGGVFLDENVSIGPGCEVKASLIFSNTSLGHLNYVGDSLLGSYINLEAGAVIANHYNERKDKTIFVSLEGKTYCTDVQKFGALVGDHTRIGANAVLSPGTILGSGSIVKRLELIEQNTEVR